MNIDLNHGLVQISAGCRSGWQKNTAVETGYAQAENSETAAQMRVIDSPMPKALFMYRFI
jgi:hypothetical protein